MTTATSAQESSRSVFERWSSLSGILYVAFFIAGVAVIEADSPDFDAPPAEVQAFWSDDGNRAHAAVGFLLVVAGVFFLLWFVAALRERIRRRDGDGLISSLIAMSGAAYAATTLAGIGLEAGILSMSDDTYQGEVFPELIHAARDAGYVMHAAGGAAVGALIVGTSVAAIRAGSVASWLGGIGVFVGVAAIFDLFFFPMILVGLWFVVVSVVMWLKEPEPRSTTTTT